MSRSTACHVLHYRSSVDDTDQPYVVAAPEPVAGTISCIVLLHDLLRPATREAFVEGALKEAARWQTALRTSSTPFMLVQPMGRGNAGWLGAGGRDLFDVLSRVQAEFPVDEDRIYLAGAGAGATGALQCGCWFPDRWAALALAGPVIDDLNDLPPGVKDFPTWEQSARQAHRSASLLSNLSGVSILLEFPWWFDGLEGTTHPEQHRRLVTLLARSGAVADVRRERPMLPGATVWPNDPKEIADWLLSKTPRTAASPRSHTAFSTRSFSGSVRVERLAQAGKPSVVKVTPLQESLTIQTRGVADLAVHALDVESIRLDRQKFASHVLEPAVDNHGWIHFQQLGEAWRAVSNKRNDRKKKPDQEETQPVKSPQLPGPVHDMRWDGVTFVVGTMGDDYETRTLERLAESLRLSWTNGSDTTAYHSGDRSSIVDYAVIADTEVTDELMGRRHLVAIGSPRTNMLLARFRGRIGVDWPTMDETGEGIDSFRIADKNYRDPQEGLFLLGANPDAPTRYLLVVTGTTTDALAWAVHFRSSYLPDYLVFRGPDVRDWGFCGADWRPV